MMDTQLIFSCRDGWRVCDGNGEEEEEERKVVGSKSFSECNSIGLVCALSCCARPAKKQLFIFGYPWDNCTSHKEEGLGGVMSLLAYRILLGS